jgi:hypothetical protein
VTVIVKSRDRTTLVRDRYNPVPEPGSHKAIVASGKKSLRQAAMKSPRTALCSVTRDRQDTLDDGRDCGTEAI